MCKNYNKSSIGSSWEDLRNELLTKEERDNLDKRTHRIKIKIDRLNKRKTIAEIKNSKY